VSVQFIFFSHSAWDCSYVISMSIIQNALGIGLGLVLYLLYTSFTHQYPTSQPSSTTAATTTGISVSTSPPKPKLPSGVTALEACQRLDKKFNIRASGTDAQHSEHLSQSAQHHWKELQCEQLLSSEHTLINGNSIHTQSQQVPVTEAQSGTDAMHAFTDKVISVVHDVKEAVVEAEHKVMDRIDHVLHPTNEASTEPEVTTGAQPTVSARISAREEECLRMRTKYHVMPGKSWGSLPDNMQK
jgi:hypothetical protein